MWGTIAEYIQASVAVAAESAQLFWESLASRASLLAVIDILLVFALLWWIYKKLRRTDMIKILPKIFLLLVMMLAARIFGLVTLFYVVGAILLIVFLAIAALYASEIKNILETPNLKVAKDTQVLRASTGDVQSMIRSLGEAFSVLTKASKPALVVIKTNRSLTRLIENGTKMHSKVRSDLLIDFFANGSTLGKGAAVIDGDMIVAAGSSLLKKNQKVLFNVTNPDIKKVARDMSAIVVIASRATGDISIVYRDDVYKNLTPQDLTKILQNVLLGS